MKVKNIAFSGFAAAILAAGAANAAPQIASKQYVDDKVKTDVATLQTTIDEALDTKADATTVNQINTTVNTLNTTVEGLEADVAGKADKLTVTEAQVGNVATVDANGQYQVGTVKASELVTNATVTEKITQALEGNESVKEIITTIVSNGDVVTDAIDQSVANGTLKTELDKKANVDDVYTKAAADAKFDTKIPVPGEACQAESGRCVLSVVKGSDGKTGLSWIDVTAPLDGTPAGE